MVSGAGRRPKGAARRGAADHRLGGGAADLRISSHHGRLEPAVAHPGRSACQPQTGLPHHAGPEFALGAAIHRAIRPPAQRQGCDHAIEPALVHGFEFTCWNGDIVRGAFIIDAHDREIISWQAIAHAGISGSDVRDMMLAAVKARFGGHRAPHQVEMLSDNGSPYIARETCIFARQPGLKPCFTPVKSPQSNGISEAFVNTLKRDYVNVTPLPDAVTVLGLITGCRRLQ